MLPNISKLGTCNIEVYEKEGTIPHFHVIGGGKNFCICLHTNEYFSHNKNKYSQFSSADQKVQLNEWLKLPNTKLSKNYGMPLTNYQAAVETWIRLNGNPYNFNFSTQPEYDKMYKEIKEK